ncbi:MAG: c-type cytochrome [bacterium]|nr:c-type cytochrome [bacterium]
MKQIVLFFALIGLIYIPIAGFTSLEGKDLKPTPVVEVQNWLLENKKTLDASLSELEAALELGEPQANLLEKYVASRNNFKKIEFLYAYLDPQLYHSYLNGAPLPKLMKKVPEQIVIEPGGFQRLDELMYEEEINTEETATIVKKLRYDLGTLNEPTIRFQLTDPVFFESIRFGILRVNTMGVTGFDRPGNTDDALTESNTFFKGIVEALEFYQPYIDQKEWNQITPLFQKASDAFSADNFEDFDRTKFQREISDPLWRQMLALQKSLKIEMPHQRHRVKQPVNYESEGLFEENFLSAEYYAMYAGHEKDEERISLGRTLFFDPILSNNNQRACASCHSPKKAFTDGLKTSKTMSGAEALRNAPSIINSVYAEKFFHDLRVDHLAAQMDHVVLNPEEFDADYISIVHKIKGSKEYRDLFAEAYGNEGITKNSVTHAVTRYVASLRSYNSRFDQYMRGETEKIDPAVVRGYNLFSGKAACATCHFAPTFSGLVPPAFIESESEVLGVPKIFKEPYELDADQGRFMNRILKEQADFYEFSFKTPTLRNVELTGPYMHNGAFATLEEVMEFYNKGGGLGLGLNVPHQTLPGDELELTDAEIDDIISFMKSLTDTAGLTSEPTRLPQFEGNAALNKRPIGGAY